MALHPHHQVMIDDISFGSNWRSERPRDDEGRFSDHYQLPPPYPMHHLGSSQIWQFPEIIWTSRTPWTPGVRWTSSTTRTAQRGRTTRSSQTIQTTQTPGLPGGGPPGRGPPRPPGTPRISRTCRTLWTQRIHRSS